jgi:hypothetical protein
LKDTLKSAISSGHGNALVYAGAIGLLVSDLIPTPADSVYFSLMQKEKRKLQNGEITPKQYWHRQAFLYYGLNPIWWSLVLGAIYLTGEGLNSKIKVGLSVIAAGAVFSVLNKNIEKDQKGQ